MVMSVMPHGVSFSCGWSLLMSLAVEPIDEEVCHMMYKLEYM